MVETAKEMIARVRHRIETVQEPVYLTKMQWAQVLGLMEGRIDLMDSVDIRIEAVRELVNAIKEQLGYEVADRRVEYGSRGKQ